MFDDEAGSLHVPARTSESYYTLRTKILVVPYQLAGVKPRGASSTSKDVVHIHHDYI